MKSLILCAAASLALIISATGCGKKVMSYAPNIEKFKATFYADGKLSDLIAGIEQGETTSPDDPFAILADAVKQQQAGQTDAAKADLKKVLGMKSLESRVHLWAWNGLREMGEMPGPEIADKAQGVVVEVPTSGGLDTLAAFNDGSARYINYSGKIIVWSKRDDRINGLAKALVSSAEPLVLPSNLSTQYQPLKKGQGRVTVLTFGGNHAIPSKRDTMDPDVSHAALNLMLALIAEATKSDQGGQ